VSRVSENCQDVCVGTDRASHVRPAELSTTETASGIWSTGSQVTARIDKNDTTGQILPDELTGLAGSGLGVLTSPEIAIQITQAIFIFYMRRNAKGTLKHLEERCLPKFIELKLLGKQFLPKSYRSDIPAIVMKEASAPNYTHTWILHIENWKSLSDAATQFEQAARIRDHVRDWAIKHHLDRQWFLDIVIHNLGVWAFSDELRRKHTWLHGTLLHAQVDHRYSETDSFKYGRSIEKVLQPPRVKPYNPVSQTREEHRKLLAIEVDRYYTEQEQFFKGKGFISTTRKRARFESPWLHVEWFVKYQILGWTAARIAQKYKLTAVHEGSIYQAVKKIAQQLDFELRPKLGTREKKKP
jgi:hypothetical protein